MRHARRRILPPAKGRFVSEAQRPLARSPPDAAKRNLRTCTSHIDRRIKTAQSSQVQEPWKLGAAALTLGIRRFSLPRESHQLVSSNQDPKTPWRKAELLLETLPGRFSSERGAPARARRAWDPPWARPQASCCAPTTAGCCCGPIASYTASAKNRGPRQPWPAIMCGDAAVNQLPIPRELEVLR